MPIPFDLDIPVFLWAMGRVIFRREERARQLGRTIPVTPAYEEVPETALTEAQNEYLHRSDQELARLGYHPICTYRATNFGNFGRILIRRYSNPTDSAWSALTVHELKVKLNKVEAIKSTSTVSFSTRFTDGKLLTTRNMSQKVLGDQPPDHIVQECRQTTDLRELKQRHDAHARQLGAPLTPAIGATEIFEEQRCIHQRLSEFQVERGIFRLLPGGEAYEVTDKAQVRGIWNYFNPFARRVSWARLIFSALLGSVLPLVAILVLAPAAVAQVKAVDPLLSLSVSLPIIAAAYSLAGLIIGWTTDWAPFYWIMLISYFPAHAVAGWSFGWLPFSTLMFLVTFSTRQMVRRRKLIFES